MPLMEISRLFFILVLYQHRTVIGSLLYLTTSRPDIAFVVGVCARYQASPRVSHLHSAKRILEYVLGTADVVHV